MSDFNYAFSNCFELTIYQSCCKYPNRSKLEEEWLNNKDSLLAFIQNVSLIVIPSPGDLLGDF